MDIITTNSFQTVLDDGGRMIVREDGAMINNALLVFPEKDPFIAAAMKTFVKKWNGYQWGNNGPVAIARTVIVSC